MEEKIKQLKATLERIESIEMNQTIFLTLNPDEEYELKVLNQELRTKIKNL